MSYTKILPRGGTKYEWTTMNPVLAEREMAVEYPDSGIGTGLCRFKFGDGFKTYNELAYAFDGASASSMIGGSAFAGNTFQIRADTHENWLLANPILEENELVYDTTLNCFYIGDGASRFNQLTPAGRDAQRVYDFGDEDEDEIVSPLTGSGASMVSVTTASSPAFAARSSAPTVSLGDLMSMALGAGIEPQPIEGGEPFIIEPVTESTPLNTESIEETGEIEEIPDSDDRNVDIDIVEEAKESDPEQEVSIESEITEEIEKQVEVEPEEGIDTSSEILEEETLEEKEENKTEDMVVE